MSAALLVLLLAAAPGGPSAADAARQAYDELRYDEAATLLEDALDDEALAADERRAALELAGVVAVIRGDEELARARFRALLQQDPEARLADGLSPKITAAFEEARASLPPAPAPPPPAKAAPAAPARAEAPVAAVPAPADEEPAVSPLVLGVAAGVGVGIVLVAVGGGALLLSSGAPPASSLGTLQLP